MRKALRDARKQRDWTQSETAQRLGITERAYRHLEAGTRTPRYETMVQLETLFGMPHKDLLATDSTPAEKAQ